MKEPKIIRFPSREVRIGSTPLGGGHPIRLQSMTNTRTDDVAGSIGQCIRIMEAGADYVRLSVPTRDSVEAFGRIGEGLRAAGFHQPLVADIHFDPELAVLVAPLAGKVRINPGNYVDRVRREPTRQSRDQEMDNIRQRIMPLVQACRQYGTALRIGTNFGSLSQRMVLEHGNTPEAMVASTMEFLEVLEDLGFTQSIVSLKASNPLVMTRAYRLMVRRMLERGMSYPLHLGVTEAGAGENGRIRSALGMAPLLGQGIGDTIRVSLTEAPELEIPFARKLAEPFNLRYIQPSRTGQYVLPVDDNELPVVPALPGGHKAVVVAHERQARHHARAGISYHNQPADGELPQPVADLLYTEQPGLRPHPGAMLLVPAALLEHKDQQGIIPLVDRGHLALDPDPWHRGFNARLLKTLPVPETLQALAHVPGLLLVPDLDGGFTPEQLEQLPGLLRRAGLQAAIIPRKTYRTKDEEALMVHLAADFGGLLLGRHINGLWVLAPRLKGGSNLPAISYGLLQAAGVRITQTEFISCPTCARTSFDLMTVLRQVQQHTSHLPGLKIAIMGCVVNGPGEMADADYGILGTATGKVHLYKGPTPLVKNIDPGQAAQQLLKIITLEDSNNDLAAP